MGWRLKEAARKYPRLTAQNRLTLMTMCEKAKDTDEMPLSYIGWRQIAYAMERGDGTPESLSHADEVAVERQMAGLRARGAIRTHHEARMQRTAAHDLSALIPYMPPPKRTQHSSESF